MQGWAFHQEFRLLAHLGADLPGAVRLEPAEDAETLFGDGDHDADALVEEDAWHFSLAGVQSEFSARWAEKGLTVPARQGEGDWLVKLPDANFPGVPENERATLQWAEWSGIDVPESRLVRLDELPRIPFLPPSGSERFALAVANWDTPQGSASF